MPKFFFPASGVGFSRLCNICFDSCHEFVNSFVHEKLLTAITFIKIQIYVRYMFKRLMKKWKVNGWQLFCILCVFAITGSVTAYLSKIITSWLGMNESTFWIWRLLVRLAVLLFGYQIIILIVALVFGQFHFFWNYEKKVLRWFRKLVSGRKPLIFFLLSAQDMYTLFSTSFDA